MKAYSLDLRLKIMQAVDSGRNKSEVARLFGVGRATIKRYAARRRDTGTLAPKPIPGDIPLVSPAQYPTMLDQLAAHPDAILAEHCRLWEEQTGQRLSTATMSRLQRRLGWTRKKKSLRASERDEVARAAFREELKELEAEDLVVVDEMGSTIALTPLYARAPRNERAYDSVPRNHGKNTTLIGALSLAGIDCAMTLEGGVTTAVVQAFVREVLGPTLRPGQTVLMDNLSSHKDDSIEQLIEARGCRLRFLPSYSPDFSPIEQAFAKIKQHLRRVGARTKEDLEAALAHAIDLITASDAHGFFRHCGYPISAQPS